MDTLNLLWGPLERNQLISPDKKEIFLRNFKEKYDKIPPEKLRMTDLKIVWKIMDKIKYNLDSDELREMFENLLVSGMTKGKDVHPLSLMLLTKWHRKMQSCSEPTMAPYIIQNTIYRSEGYSL